MPRMPAEIEELPSAAFVADPTVIGESGRPFDGAALVSAWLVDRFAR